MTTKLTQEERIRRQVAKAAKASDRANDAAFRAWSALYQIRSIANENKPSGVVGSVLDLICAEEDKADVAHTEAHARMRDFNALARLMGVGGER